MSTQEPETPRAWHRREGESSRSHHALLAFLRLGPTRSAAAVAAELDSTVSAVRKLAERWSWTERSRAYDNALADALVNHDAEGSQNG